MNKQEKEEKLKKELASFEHIALWEGGYYEGDPLDPEGTSSYDERGLGRISILYATYLRCIKPYVKPDTVVLQIGVGKGAWTKTMLRAKEIYALDALPEKTNHFFEYLGYPYNVKYFQVKDFSCDMLPENHFDYMFSFGCMPHISLTGITEYAINLYTKLKTGANCFWMIADFEQYNRVCKYVGTSSELHSWDETPVPSRWYDTGLNRIVPMLEETGYHILDRDVGTNPRDPIIWFTK